MWKSKISADYERRHKKYLKRHRRELLAVLNNLDTYAKALGRGVKPLQITGGFIHPEPHGVVAIDQQGGGASLKETRLYVFPEVETEVLHVITLGDKGSQGRDIETSSAYVMQLRKEAKHERREDIHERVGDDQGSL